MMIVRMVVPVDNCNILTIKGKIVRKFIYEYSSISDKIRKVHEFKYRIGEPSY